MSPGAATISAGFADPPPGYGPVPFWWWVGGTLELGRLCWQLDQLREKGIFSAIISYNHHADGTTNVGDPPIFSEAWWTIFQAVLDHARQHGMTLGIQDYSLLKPMLKAIGESNPGLRGAELRHVTAKATPDRACALAWPTDAKLIEATAWRDGTTIDIRADAGKGGLQWAPAEEEWQVAAVFSVPTPFDPLHPDSGARSLAAFQQMIADRIGDHLGRTLTMFFQDELDFGARWPFWTPTIPAAFARSKGYALSGRLAELWCDRGPATAKLRVDFADVAVGLLERHYFKPVHEWHEQHDCLFGHDNAGRGAIAVGRDYYGDYMRTMRWYSAPGSDDPDLRGPRAFKGLKVASSIATLYRRPRVWAECFHSSGWGATPAAMIDGLNGVFSLGATLINLHGLYYTTAASWWEWAPPDFHFRQPYWACMEAFNAYATRLSWLLAQGEPVSDVAILYPSAAIAGGLNSPVDPSQADQPPLSEAQRFEAQPPVDAAEAACFSVARSLFAQAVAFDFIDDASVGEATISGGLLRAGAGRWGTLVLPEMTTICWETLCRLREFARSGGRVVAVGALPQTSDRGGFADAEFAAAVAELFGEDGTGLHIPEAGSNPAALIVPPAQRHIRIAGGAVHVLQRRITGCDALFVRNPNDEPVECDLTVRGVGQAWLMDPYSGGSRLIASRNTETTTSVSLAIAPSSAAVVLIDESSREQIVELPQAEREVRRLDRWHYRLLPTMDNRFNDFDSSDPVVGVEIRRFQWGEGEMPPSDLDAWQSIAPGHAPRMKCIGPIYAARDLGDWEEAVAATPPGTMPPDLVIDECLYSWRDYHFSTRHGILDDPFLKHWASGPHGLKDNIPDDYIDLPGDPGAVWYVTTTARVGKPGTVRIVAGSRAAYRLWAAGKALIDQAEALPPGRLPEWGLPTYESEPRETDVVIPSDGTRIFLRLVHPGDQRLRAHVGLAGTPSPDHRALRWFVDGSLSISPDAELAVRPQWFRMQVPPGATALDVHHLGVLSAWRDGVSMSLNSAELPDGSFQSRVAADAIFEHRSAVMLRIDWTGQSRAGDCILSPIRLIDPQGPIGLGDWSDQGLASYSGGVEYSCVFDLEEPLLGETLVLETGKVGAVAQVELNGRALGCVLAPPWRVDLGNAAVAQGNRIKIRVFNTLANHYDQATPTPYVFPGQTISGLLALPKIIAK